MYRRQLHDCKQVQGESLRALSQRVLRVMHWAYPNGEGYNVMYEEILKTTFIYALIDRDLRCKLMEGREKWNFSELVNESVRLNAIHRFYRAGEPDDVWVC